MGSGERTKVPAILTSFGGPAVLFALLMLWNQTHTARQNAMRTTTAFESLVLHKTVPEVLKAVGKPDGTTRSQTHETWFYKGRAKDPITGKTANITLRFRGESNNVRCDSVNSTTSSQDMIRTISP